MPIPILPNSTPASLRNRLIQYLRSNESEAISVAEFLLSVIDSANGEDLSPEELIERLRSSLLELQASIDELIQQLSQN